MKKTISKSLPQIVILIVIVAIGISIVFKELGIPNAKKTNASPSPAGRTTTDTGGNKRVFAVRAAVVTAGSVSNYTKLHGDVVVDNEIKIYPSVSGKLLERKISVGDRVSKGTVIAIVDPSKIGESYLPNPVESPVSGTVLSIPVHEGDTIAANTVIATIGNLSRYKISAAVPERYLGNLRIGSVAEISFDAIPGIIFSARVSEMSPVVDSSSRTMEVKLELDRADPRILAGMFATVKLVTESRRNVLVVPRSAVTQSSGESYVFVIGKDASVEKRSVTLGLEGEDSFEAKKGLSAGETLVTEGKSSLAGGDRVRIVDESGTSADPAKAKDASLK
ncbi:MAG: efflux RND transporter periplasmic adaptor subunit [Spirochaetae bacterium HGW-Spirochaetae-9]|nr:MAG: efflux RND transporter periplasmic adaptor subunit [Spirochaetae bacterium HGW-Spirochaetae-9]